MIRLELSDDEAQWLMKLIFRSDHLTQRPELRELSKNLVPVATELSRKVEEAKDKARRPL